jgi:hypothetical protein
VAIVNDSGRPLRLRYNDFKLVNPSGLAITALPPLRIEATVRTPVRVVPGFLYTRFWVAPFYAPYYSGISPWGGPFDFDPLYYDGYYSYWQQPLPTEDMLAQTIPEGVLEDDGRVAGFLYFSEVRAETDRVNFIMELVDASTGENFGRILVPFLVKEI